MFNLTPTYSKLCCFSFSIGLWIRRSKKIKNEINEAKTNGPGNAQCIQMIGHKSEDFEKRIVARNKSVAHLFVLISENKETR